MKARVRQTERYQDKGDNPHEGDKSPTCDSLSSL